MKIIKRPAAEVEFHPVSNKHPRMSEEQFKGLVSDIELNGQLEPIRLYRGKVVDGRHRTWAARELGIDTVDCVELPHKTTMKELEQIVASTENRRHQTGTQRACIAYLEMISEGTGNITSADQARKYGVNKAYLSMCKAIAEKMGIDVIKGFIGGDSQRLLVNGTYSNYPNISRLYSAIKREKEKVVLPKSDNTRVDLLEIQLVARKTLDMFQTREEKKVFIDSLNLMFSEAEQ